MSDTHILRVNQVCSICGYRNMIEHTTDFPIHIIACGKCGEFILFPPDFYKEDKDIVSEIINKVIEEGPDAIL